MVCMIFCLMDLFLWWKLDGKKCDLGSVCVCVSVFVFLLGDRKNHHFVVQPKLEGRVVFLFNSTWLLFPCTWIALWVGMCFFLVKGLVMNLGDLMCCMPLLGVSWSDYTYTDPQELCKHTGFAERCKANSRSYNLYFQVHGKRHSTNGFHCLDIVL